MDSNKVDGTPDIGLGSADRDTLLVDLITYMHRRPSAALNDRRTDPRFRAFYQAQLPAYALLMLEKKDDGTHWFYVSRPARSVKGDRRGVAGRFRMGADGKPTGFEEIFNTPVLSEDSVKLVGAILFPLMVAGHGTVPLADDRRLVEWPDERLYYDKEKQEWRAVGAPKDP